MYTNVQVLLSNMVYAVDDESLVDADVNLHWSFPCFLHFLKRYLSYTLLVIPLPHISAHICRRMSLFQTGIRFWFLIFLSSLDLIVIFFNNWYSFSRYWVVNNLEPTLWYRIWSLVFIHHDFMEVIMLKKMYVFEFVILMSCSSSF